MPALTRPNQLHRPDGVRLAMITAVIGTIFIAAGAFWLSFTSLSDLARRSGFDPAQAWVWPLIVDGIIVVATVAAVALARSRVAWYPWMLLIAGAAISVAANAIHAIVADSIEVPLFLAASVSAVPPLVLLAITHLTSVLMRAPRKTASAEATAPAAAKSRPPAATIIRQQPGAALVPRDDASSLRALGWSNSAIARQLGVHPSTIGRWLRDHVGAPTSQTGTVREGASDG
ncbi:DUF2637 domain-containing protein [Agromyces bauzanensis]|uniref:DUF2637 domain-containing protein n=1 Tax=Agromyces bauzanensis TaxID=1308924 RepID=A0A917PGX7_9MICO|nr:DUF2637 domain-containing protein [Agromyces bauzanensis]GGJ76530.1 hypothetical protein GCM10011372_13440 [Agromyces bauzanensis]